MDEKKLVETCNNTNEITIDIYLINLNHGLVFDPEHINLLRKQPYRICGQLIGIDTTNPYQISELSSPLLIAFEEIKLLASLVNLRLYDRIKLDDDYDDDSKRLIETVKLEYQNYLKNFYNEQNINYRLKRQNELNELKFKIIEGKSKSIRGKINQFEKQLQILTSSKTEDKSNTNSTNNNNNIEIEEINIKISSLNKELENLNSNNLNIEIKDLNINEINKEFFLKTPKFLSKQYKMNYINLNDYLKSTLEINNKYLIYKYFWSLGYYITVNACKFGGDYLIYPGDPCVYHSKYILLCLNEYDYKNITFKQLIHFGRMATNVKKTFVIACIIDSSSSSSVICAETHVVNEKIEQISLSPSLSPSIKTVKSAIKNTVEFENKKIMFMLINWSHM